MINTKNNTNKYFIWISFIFFLIPFVIQFIVPYILNGNSLVFRYQFPGQQLIFFRTFNETILSNNLKLALFYSIIFITILIFYLYLVIKRKEINYKIKNYKNKKKKTYILFLFLIMEILFFQTYFFNQNIFFQPLEAAKYILLFYFIFIIFKRMNESRLPIFEVMLLFIFFITLGFMIFSNEKSSIFDLYIISYLSIFYAVILRLDRNKKIFLIFLIIISLITVNFIKENIRTKNFLKIIDPYNNSYLKNYSAMTSYYNKRINNPNFITDLIDDEKIRLNITEGYINKIKFLDHEKFRIIHLISQRTIKITEFAWAITIHKNNELLNKISNNSVARKNFLLGDTYKPFFTKIIPRYFYKNKPIENYANIYGRNYYLMNEYDNSTAQNLHILIEAYINYSFYGVLLLSIFIGSFIFIIFNIVLKTKTELNKILFVSPIILFSLSMESNLSLSFSGIIFIYLLLYIFINNSFKKKFKSIFIVPFCKIIFPSR